VLTAYVGPVAAIMSKSILETSDTPTEAIKRLADKFPDKTQAQDFMYEMQKQLS